MSAVKFKKTHEDSIVPTVATEGSAGFDLYARDPAVIHVGGRKIVGTGICAAIPKGYVGLIRARSSLATKQGLEVVAGVIDSDYRGEIMVCLHNISCLQYEKREIKPGDRIAQLIVMPCLTANEVVEDLDETARGDGGFGSTGA